MKIPLPFTIYDSRFTIEKKSPPPVIAGRSACAAVNRKSPIVNHKSRGGFALIITLILLSVTLIMAVAFLAISRRERGSVTTSTDTATARLAADSALANAEAQIMSTVLADTNPFINNLIVSTNYINVYGFTNGSANPLNINYDHYNNGGGQLSKADFLQNVANLQYLPRVPVFVPTNNLGSNDFRFYLDLNRNGKFEDSGAVQAIGPNGGYLHPNGTEDNNPVNGITNFLMGDPQWIGVLERPDAPHGPNNKFVARYAFIAVPADNALDLNYIHNQSLHGSTSTSVNPPTAGDVYFRNQGIGSWEINLAALLADLNTNEWGQVVGSGPSSPVGSATYYQYNQLGNGNLGDAFDDARALLAYRYNNNFAWLSSLPAFLPNYPLYPLTGGPVDIFPFGPAMTRTAMPFYNYSLNNSWPGANSTNHFFALPSDLFDTTKTELGVTAPAPGFTDHLLQAGTNNSTYDRYTFYRLLSQLGTDSSAESGKMNLNYDNLDPVLFPVTRVVRSPAALTNFMAWTPIAFFTNAADRMLRIYSTNWFQANPTNYLETYYGVVPQGYLDSTGMGVTNVQFLSQTNVIPAFSLTNIPVYVNGRFVYSSAVHRVLQLAANIYDASTNSFYPTIFRPIFEHDNLGNVFITGFTTLNNGLVPNGAADSQLALPHDVPALATLSPNYTPITVNGAYVNVYGVPWIIGAKKGFPNFNEFSMQDVVQVTRLLQMKRLTTSSPPNATNQMYLFGITNSLGIEFWNSYTNGYSNQVQVVVRDSLTMQMAFTNGPLLTFVPVNPNPITIGLNTFTNVAVWPRRSFVLPLNTNVMFLPYSQYDFNNKQFDYVGNNPNPSFETIKPYAFANLPQMLLQTTNRLQAFVLDATGTHVIDYVSFGGPQSSRNLNSEIFNTNAAALSQVDYYTNLVWSTAPAASGDPLGIDTQIGISDGSIGYNATYWRSAPGLTGKPADEIKGFQAFLNPNSPRTPGMLYATNLVVQVPYAPCMANYEYISWQANDPLVHYLQSDLVYTGSDPQSGSSTVQTGVHRQAITMTTSLPLLPDLGKVNARYQPWGVLPPTVGTGIAQNNYDENPYSLAFKDPLMTQSDNWDFPTNKFPTVGWLGRVHRGTPWQTVYLKATNILDDVVINSGIPYRVGTNTWAVWTGNSANPVDGANSAPVQDRLLFDIFSTAPNDNATHGQLSVNVAANSKDPGAGLAAWSAVFSGMVGLTNTTVMPPFHTTASIQASNSWVVIQPAGLAGTNSLLGQLVVGINNTRASISNADGVVGAFEHVGDVLRTPQLTEQSPILNWNNVNQAQQGISDEVYEWLPQQAMSLLRASTAPRYVIYCYGQALKPAPNGVVSSGGANVFGMVTNYQVVAESASRAVVQFKQVVVTNSLVPLLIQTNYNATIEQSNPLPPD